MSYVSPENSKLLYGTSPHIAADGVQQAVIKIRLRDNDNQPVANRQVELLTDGEDVSIVQPGLTDANGIALAYATTTTPGSVIISGRVIPVATP
jgi:hypothetical protein